MAQPPPTIESYQASSDNVMFLFHSLSQPGRLWPVTKCSHCGCSARKPPKPAGARVLLFFIAGCAGLLPLCGASAAPTGDYAAWLARHFPQAYPQPSLEAAIWGEQADPDGDGCVNAVEFITARDPNTADPQLAPSCRMDGEDLVITYRETTAANPGLAWSGKWTVDLVFWVREGVRFQTIETHATYRLVEARISKGREKMIFFQVAIEE